LGLSGGLLLL
jgi:hypothetical protein